MMRDELIQYIHDNVASEFDPDSDELVVFLDSVSLLQFVLFVEQTAGVQIDLSVVGLEPFSTMDTLCQWLARSAAEGVAAA